MMIVIYTAAALPGPSRVPFLVRGRPRGGRPPGPSRLGGGLGRQELHLAAPVDDAQSSGVDLAEELQPRYRPWPITRQGQTVAR